MDDPNTFLTALSEDARIYAEVLKVVDTQSGVCLDVGAGRGLLTQQLLKLNFDQVYACDKHPEFFRVKDVQCAKCDLDKEGLAYPDNTFDLVVCTEVLEHLENPRYAIREINRVLKKGGILIASHPNNLSLRSRLSFCFKGYSAYVYGRNPDKESAHITILSRHDLIHVLKRSGFSLERVWYMTGVIPKLKISWHIFPWCRNKELFSDTIMWKAVKTA